MQSASQEAGDGVDGVVLVAVVLAALAVLSLAIALSMRAPRGAGCRCVRAATRHRDAAARRRRREHALHSAV